MASGRNPWLSLAAEAARLQFEAQDVIALRLATLAGGGPAAGEEGALMILEKAVMMWDASCLVSRCMWAGEAHLAPARTMGLIRRRVRANHRRLSKGRTGRAP